MQFNRTLASGLAAAATLCATSLASAATIYATGQLLTPGPPGHGDLRENFLYSIDSSTGIATPISPTTTGLPPALGGTPDGRLLGFSSGQLVEVDLSTGTSTPVGGPSGVSATGFDVLDDGRAFVVTFSDDRLYSIDTTTGLASPVGTPGQINAALLAAGATAPNAFVISLGSVGVHLYGIDLDTNTLLRMDPNDGSAAVVGALGAVGSVGAGVFSGFSALTGIDENGDGQYDALFGSVNFLNPAGPEPSIRLGGVARFDLDDGTFDLVGINDGVIFFGFGSNPIPEPSTAGLLLLGSLGLLRRNRSKRFPSTSTSHSGEFMHLRSVAPAVAVMALGSASLAFAATEYNLSAVPTLDGGTRNFALDLNNARQVTGNSGMAGNTTLNPYLATGASATYLGTIDTSNVFGRGYAVNDAGVVVGESNNDSSNAFIWDSANGIRELFSIAGTSSGVAHDINNNNLIVGISSNGLASRPTLYTPNGSGGFAASDLGSLDGQNNTLGRAWGINDAGTAVGVSRRQTTPTSVSQATRWQNGAITNLGSLQPDSFSEAFAINESGVAVGTAVNGATGGGTSIRRAVRFDNGTVTDLGSLGRTFSEAKDINDAGTIVGFTTNISGSPQAAFVFEDGVMIDLNTLIPAGSGWTLTSAEGINDNGDIAGFGTFGGNTRAFLLTPIPEPTSMALLGLGGLAMLRRRR